MSSLIQQAAKEYLARKWSPIPLKSKGKEPTVKWSKFDAEHDGLRHFDGNVNIGVKLGSPSQGLTDIDLDWPQAAQIASLVFAELPAFGRANSKASHRLLYIEGEVKRVAFTLPATAKGVSGLPDDHALVVSELRSNGSYTMFPPSTHPSGEVVEWESSLDNIPRLTKEVALRKLGLVSALAVCLRFYPASGIRDDMHMALAGTLARGGYSAEEIDGLNILLAELAGDEEAKSRAKGSRTHSQLAEGNEVTSAPRLVELLGLPKECVETFNAWLGVGSTGKLPTLGDERKILNLRQPYEWVQIFQQIEKPHLLYFGRDFYDYDGVKYNALDTEVVRKAAYDFLSTCFYHTKDDIEKFPTDKQNVDKFFHALEAWLAKPSVNARPPLWLVDSDVDPNDLVVCRNCIVHVPTGRTHEHTPKLFNLNALGYDYNPQAGTPEVWLKFLADIWPPAEHQDSIDTLQEIMGYLLTSQTHLQKMFFLVGATRAGKGVILRTITNLIGAANVAGMNLSDVEDRFGLESLLGKKVGQFSDARLSSKSDTSNIIEKLLKISGEDVMTVQRKFKTAVTTQLTARLVFAANEIPILTDASTALANRFIFLHLPNSHLGKEDPSLTHRIAMECDKILSWAIVGYRRLEERGYFIQPKSGQEKLDAMERIASPVKAFIFEECELGAGFKIPTNELFQAYLRWCDNMGINLYRTQEVFGSKLASAITSVNRSELTDKGTGRRIAHYMGVRLRSKVSESPF